MIDAITFWLHILGAAIWVGPQFFLFIASMPAVRLIEDQPTRTSVMRVMTRRFGYLAMAAMVIIVLTGISNLGSVQADTGINIGSFEFRYAWILLAKLILVGITIAFTMIHAMFIGPRLLRLQEEAHRVKGRMRALSISLSALNLLIAIGIIYAASVLAQHDFSLRPI